MEALVEQFIHQLLALILGQPIPVHPPLGTELPQLSVFFSVRGGMTTLSPI